MLPTNPSRASRCSRRGASCLVALLAAALLLSGCATYHRIEPYPKAGKPATVAVGAAPLSKMNDLPIGAFYDEPHRIVVTGHQKGLGVGMMFGLVGVLVANSANKAAGESRFGGDAAKMSTDLVSITHELLAGDLAATKIAAVRELRTDAGDIEVMPFALFTVAKDGKARLYALLKAELKGADGAPAWSVRYFARAAGEYPVEGAGGWSEGERFTTGIRAALGRVTTVFLEELQGQLTGSHKVKAKGRYPFIGTDVELPLILVKEEGDYVVGRMAIGDAMTLAGTHVLDRADFSFVDADFKTPQ